MKDPLKMKTGINTLKSSHTKSELIKASEKANPLVIMIIIKIWKVDIHKIHKEKGKIGNKFWEKIAHQLST